jgi:hypothetical protein
MLATGTGRITDGQYKIYNMKLYTKEQTTFLIKYYTPLMVGQPMLNDSKVISLTKDECIGGDFMIRVNGSVDRSTFIAPFSWLDPMTEKLNLISPEEALKELNQ